MTLQTLAQKRSRAISSNNADSAATLLTVRESLNAFICRQSFWSDRLNWCSLPSVFSWALNTLLYRWFQKFLEHRLLRNGDYLLTIEERDAATEFLVCFTISVKWITNLPHCFSFKLKGWFLITQSYHLLWINLWIFMLWLIELEDLNPDLF